MDKGSSGRLVNQGNLANTYHMLGRLDDALRTRQDVYSRKLKLLGEESRSTLLEAKNYADLLIELKRFKEAKSLMCKTMPGARRVLGENNELTLRMRWNYGEALYQAEGATLDDLREAVTTLAEITRTARRVMGGTHPLTVGIEGALREAWALLRAHETPPAGDG